MRPLSGDTHSHSRLLFPHSPAGSHSRASPVHRWMPAACKRAHWGKQLAGMRVEKEAHVITSHAARLASHLLAAGTGPAPQMPCSAQPYATHAATPTSPSGRDHTGDRIETPAERLSVRGWRSLSSLPIGEVTRRPGRGDGTQLPAKSSPGSAGDAALRVKAATRWCAMFLTCEKKRDR